MDREAFQGLWDLDSISSEHNELNSSPGVGDYLERMMDEQGTDLLSFSQPFIMVEQYRERARPSLQQDNERMMLEERLTVGLSYKSLLNVGRNNTMRADSDSIYEMLNDVRWFHTEVSRYQRDYELCQEPK